jgi:hypothetical protein
MKRNAVQATLIFSVLQAACSSLPQQESKNESPIADAQEGVKAERDKQIETFKSEIRRATVDYLAANEAGWQIIGWSPLLDKELKEALKPGPFGGFTAKEIQQGIERVRAYPLVLGVDIGSGSSRRSVDLVARSFSGTDGAPYWKVEPLTSELRELIRTLKRREGDESSSSFGDTN